MKKTRLSSVASLLAAGVLMGGCMADVGGESDSEGGAAQGPNVVGGEALGEAKQALTCGVLSGGQTLSANQSNTSCDGRYMLLTQGTDGNVVLYGPKGAVWATHVGGAGNRLVMQTDGNLVVYSPSNVPVWYSRTAGHSGAKLAIQNDGKLELYTPSGHVLWQSACRSAICGLAGEIKRTAQVAGGYEHSLTVKSDGTVWASGSNNMGQLGDGTRVYKLTPAKVANLTDVVSAAAGEYHSLAVKSDGTVWIWGWFTNTPTQMSTLTNVVAVAAGNHHSLALKSDGTLWAWGNNDLGQLGIGSRTANNTPTQVLTDVVSVSAGEYQSLAAKSDGTVWAWGRYGVRDNGTMMESNSPTQVAGLTGAVAVGAGRYHNMVLKGDGTVWGWGNNEGGILGDGTTLRRETPVQVQGLTGVVSLDVGYYHYTLALKGDGTLWGWGSNASGQMGDGTWTDSPSPKKLMEGVVAMDAGYSHVMAVKRDGTLWTWGQNYYGKLGDGTWGVGQTRNTQAQVLTSVKLW